MFKNRKDEITADVLKIARQAGAGPEDVADALGDLEREGLISRNADGTWTVN